MNDLLNELKASLAQVSDLQNAAALLHWDQATYMPEGGALARGRQIATLEGMAHEKFTDARIGELLESLRGLEESTPSGDDAALVRVTRREWEKAVRIPAEFQSRLSDHTAQTYQAWTVARPANDFASVAQMLEKTLELSREMSSFFPSEHIADPLIEFSDEGMTVGVLRPLFAELRKELVSLVEAIQNKPPVSDKCLRQSFETEKQVAFAKHLATEIGYDWNRGRLDETHHPFMTKFSLGDVRITNRVHDNDLGDCLFGTIHETGHALYEQGIDRAYESTPLGNGTSSGVHESQSRLWENIVGRSRPFWKRFYPDLQKTFASQLGNAELEEWYCAINKVAPTLIRTEADEVTYNLHVMIRFELELQLLEGALAITDLPEAWRAMYSEYLGVSSEDDTDGVLQDVHWFAGPIGGAFQGYSIGNILASQFYDCALKSDPQIAVESESANYGPLLNWLRENIYRHGAKYTAPELIERVTGGGICTDAYLKYLKNKFLE